MKKAYSLKFSTLLIGFACALNSCSKEQDVQLASHNTTARADVQVINGCLVFRDQKVFEQVRKELQQKAFLKEGDRQLDAWEKNMHFTSLRSAATSERVHLEQLDLQGQSAPAHTLMDGFGFPDSYATLISPSGEYQIGTKIYWFHDGFKYEAGSRIELNFIKLNPSLAKHKAKAGSELIKHTAKYTSASLTQHGSGDLDKYAFQFFLEMSHVA